MLDSIMPMGFDGSKSFLYTGQYLGVRGRRPLAWANVQTNAFGMIAAGQLTDMPKYLEANTFMASAIRIAGWRVRLLSGIGAAQTLSGWSSKM